MKKSKKKKKKKFWEKKNNLWQKLEEPHIIESSCFGGKNSIK